MSASLRWAPHRTFGLREEWVQLFLEDPAGWRINDTLGPRQVQAVDAWLITCGLLDSQGQPGVLAQMMVRGDGAKAWELVWVNTVFSFKPAWFYVGLPLETETTARTLTQRLISAYPERSARTIWDGVIELVGTLERTPIGSALGQGIVSATRPRTVRRVGLARPDVVPLAHAMRRLFQHEGREDLHLVEPLTWPWVVFGCDAEETVLRLSSETKDWLEIRADRVRLRIPREELDELALF